MALEQFKEKKRENETDTYSHYKQKRTNNSHSFLPREDMKLLKSFKGWGGERGQRILRHWSLLALIMRLWSLIRAWSDHGVHHQFSIARTGQSHDWENWGLDTNVHYNTEVKRLKYKQGGPQFKSHFCHELSQWPQTSHSLQVFPIPICNMVIITLQL